MSTNENKPQVEPTEPEGAPDAPAETEGPVWVKLTRSTVGLRAGTVVCLDRKTAERLLANGNAGRAEAPEEQPAEEPESPKRGRGRG